MVAMMFSLLKMSDFYTMAEVFNMFPLYLVYESIQ